MKSLLDITARDFIKDCVITPINSIKGSFSEIKIDLKKEKNNYVLEADLLDFKKPEIKIFYENGFLTIVANKSEERKEETDYVIREREAVSVKRSIYVGDIDETKIDASFKDGKLTVIIPCNENKDLKKEIIIK